jgi:hypothetical protein
MNAVSQAATEASSPKVFICYRREEAAAHAGRLHDAMVARFGEGNVFMDVELAPGVDYVERIPEVVAGCHVLIVVMGPRWATVEDGDGDVRIADPEDFVRLEVEAGLRRSDVTSIPVLVSGAQMPRREDLPPEVEPIARRNALELSEGRWRYDVGRLISTLDELLPEATRAAGTPPSTAAQPAPTPASSLVVLEGTLLAGAVGYLARLLSNAIEKPPAGTEPVEFVTRISLVRAIAWGAVGTALALWLALRTRRRADLLPFAIYGLLVGAIGGAIGGVVWAVPVELADLAVKGDEANWIELGSLAVTGAFLGALVGRVWLPPRLGAGLAAGIVAGALVQLILIGLDTKISQPLKYGIFAAAIAAVALAVLALGGQRSRAEPALDADR